jgi:ABC-type dipeptide/oligopeptide/nickel transport system permease subunit
MDVLSLIIGFGLGFVAGIFIKWIARFINYVKTGGK